MLIEILFDGRVGLDVDEPLSAVAFAADGEVPEKCGVKGRGVKEGEGFRAGFDGGVAEGFDVAWQARWYVGGEFAVEAGC